MIAAATSFDWVSFAQTYGPAITMPLIALVTLMRRMWAPGWVLKECEARNTKVEESRARWERVALRGTTLAESGTDLAKELSSLAKIAKERGE